MMSFFTVEKLFSLSFYVAAGFFLIGLGYSGTSLAPTGLFLIILSFLVFSRFLWLATARLKKDERNLPDQILSSLSDDAEKNKDNIFKRSCALDFGSFLLLIFLSGAWGIYCSIYPNEITSIKTLYIEFGNFFGDAYGKEDLEFGNLREQIFQYISLLLIVLLMSWLQLSLSISKRFVRHNLVVFWPAFLVGVVILNFIVGRVLLFQWPDTLFLSGGGLGIAEPLMLLHPDLAQDSMSFFMVRFFELGFVGAYGAYLFLLIPLSVFFHIIMIRQRRKTLAYIGMMSVAVVIMMDMFWLYHPYGLSVMAMGWFVIVVCWGQSGFKTPYILR